MGRVKCLIYSGIPETHDIIAIKSTGEELRIIIITDKQRNTLNHQIILKGNFNEDLARILNTLRNCSEVRALILSKSAYQAIITFTAAVTHSKTKEINIECNIATKQICKVSTSTINVSIKNRNKKPKNKTQKNQQNKA